VSTGARPLAPAPLAGAHRLVGGIVHELRNPVFALGATLDALEQRLGPRDEIRPHLEVLRHELGRLADLARDLGELEPSTARREPTDARELLSRVVAERERRAAERQVALIARLPSRAGLLNADGARLAMGIGRVVDFAVARTPAGGDVTVRAHKADRAGGPGLQVLVIDSGPGLPAEALRDALVPFGVRREGKLTLDLAIAAATVAEHGGTMQVENGSAEGLRIIIDLPLVQANTQAGG
jgi:signal transduction histidine kinase